MNEIPKQLKDEIREYCRLNNITNVDDFTITLLQQGFTAKKYGATPWNKESEVKEVIKEVIVEKVVTREID